MQGVLKKGAKAAGTIAILKKPLTWIITGILLLLTSIFGLALFISISLGGENQFESGMSEKELEERHKCLLKSCRMNPLYKNMQRNMR
jgi:hypothetical protein